MADVTVLPKEVRQARAFLHREGVQEIPARTFALHAKKSGKTFAELLLQIAKLMLGGQGQGQAPEAKELAKTQG